MEIIGDISHQYVVYIPMALVIFGAILIFTFGIKSPQQPRFDKLSSEDRKSSGKKRKIKEKKTIVNGHVHTEEIKHEKSPAKESKKTPSKDSYELKPEQRDKKSENNKQIENKEKILKVNEQVRNRKNLKKSSVVKPIDFDEGDWETVPLKSDKKKKAEQSPSKIKKNGKNEGNKTFENLKKVEVEKIKEVNCELEKGVTDHILEEIITKDESLVIDESVAIVEEKKEKKEKKNERKNKKDMLDIVSFASRDKQKSLEGNHKEVIKTEGKVEGKVKDIPALKSQSPNEPAPVFDEIGDIWTDAKPTKKSKKKTRKDN